MQILRIVHQVDMLIYLFYKRFLDALYSKTRCELIKSSKLTNCLFELRSPNTAGAAKLNRSRQFTLAYQFVDVCPMNPQTFCDFIDGEKIIAMHGCLH